MRRRLRAPEVVSVCSRMDFKHFMFLLLCAAALIVSGAFGEYESDEAYRWSRQSPPILVDTHTKILSKPLFRGQWKDKERGGSKTLCGIECQRSLLPIDQAEQERILGYETMYENGTRTHTEITLLGFNSTSTTMPAHAPSHSRRKRQIYGPDGRFVISDSQFSTNYPFSAAVRVSTGCSGVLVSPKHVLTAAHCIHDGRDYLESARRIRVGVLKIKIKRRRLGRKRRWRKRFGKKGEGEAVEQQNGINEDVVRERKRGRKHRERNEDNQVSADDGNMDESKRGGRKQKRVGHRTPRSIEPKKQTVFRWSPVKQTHIPQGWIHSTNSVASDYDYALLELKRPIKTKHMELGLAPSVHPLARVHFSGYDADKSLLDGHGDEKVVYRFCSVEKESDDLMYQHCDAQPGANGAGIYIRLRQKAGDAGKEGKWQRRVIGVYSGHQWVEVEGGEQRDFNVAVRITPPKYAQICHWIHEDPRHCKEV